MNKMSYNLMKTKKNSDKMNQDTHLLHKYYQKKTKPLLTLAFNSYPTDILSKVNMVNTASAFFTPPPDKRRC